MKIIKIESWPFIMRLREPYTIAYESIDKTTNIFIRIETNEGITGYGCATPDKAVTGETPESVLYIMDNTAIPTLKGANP